MNFALMEKLLKNLIQLKNDVRKEKGPVCLFGLFLRKSAPDRYDVVISAPWASENEASASLCLAKKLQARLSPEEIVYLSQIVVLNGKDPLVQSIYCQIPAGTDLDAYKPQNMLLSPAANLHSAYIITSKALTPARSV